MLTVDNYKSKVDIPVSLSFGYVVVRFDAAVIKETHQRTPVAKAVTDSHAPWVTWPRSDQVLPQSFVHLLQNRPRSLLPLTSSQFRALSSDVRLRRIDIYNSLQCLMRQGAG